MKRRRQYNADNAGLGLYDEPAPMRQERPQLRDGTPDYVYEAPLKTAAASVSNPSIVLGRDPGTFYGLAFTRWGMIAGPVRKSRDEALSALKQNLDLHERHSKACGVKP